MPRSVCLITALALVLIMLITPSTAFCQTVEPPPTETPTITPTPANVVGIPLSSGGELVIDKRITYGEIAITAAVILLVVVVLLVAAVVIPKMWMR